MDSGTNKTGHAWVRVQMQLLIPRMLFIWQTVQIICACFNVLMLWYHLLIMEIMYAPKGVPMDFMQIISPNNVYLNVLQFQMILLLKTPLIFVWVNAQRELLEVHKISIVCHNVGGLISLTKQRGYVCRLVLMVTLRKMRQPVATKIVTRTHMQILQQKDVSWTVLICINFSNWTRTGVV